MNNNIKRIIITLLFVFMITNIFINISIATGSYYDVMNNTLKTVDSAPDTTNTSKEIGNIITTIMIVTRIIGLGVAFTMLAVIAMKYMTAAPGEKADIKKSSVVYVVGAIILFGIVGILKLIELAAHAIN